ncbi:MAG TPA: helical backbone metal receptor [Candidatus Marinimicrobia bacterium]|nr:helical backbone metal receptor [Candidatus Neomarinimicrobiota bacterium]HRU93307.1 helical backbone metal receptor [Candidatus Neomarinimicrobiota bacterium]
MQRFKKCSLILSLILLITYNSCSKTNRPKIVSCSSTLTEIVYEIGGREQVIGATSFCFFPEQVIQDKASGRVKVIGDFIHINYNRIDSLKPDLILTDTDMQRQIADSLRKMGYKVLHYEPKSLDDVLNCIIDVGENIGCSKRAHRIVENMKSEIAAIRAQTDILPKTKVYLEINHMGPWTVGNDSPLEDLIEIAGGENIFGDTTVGVFVTTNAEIVKRNPDIILSPIWLDAELGGWKGITPLYEIYTRPNYIKTNAVIHSRVSYYDSALLKHEGPRQILAIRKLAYLLHPNEFDNPKGTIPWELGWIK